MMSKKIPRHLYLLQGTFTTPTAAAGADLVELFHEVTLLMDLLPEVKLLIDILQEVTLLMDLLKEVTLLMDFLHEVTLLVELLPPHPPDLQQLLPSEATGGAVTLVAGIRVGSSTGQPIFRVTPEKGRGEVRRKNDS